MNAFHFPAIPSMHGPDLESALRVVMIAFSAYVLFAIWRTQRVELSIKRASICAGVVCFFLGCATDLVLAGKGLQVSTFHRGLYHGVAIDQNIVFAALGGSGLCVLWPALSRSRKAGVLALSICAEVLADHAAFPFPGELARRMALTAVTLLAFEGILRDRLLLVRAIGYPLMNISVLYVLLPALIMEVAEQRNFYLEIVHSPMVLLLFSLFSAAIFWSGITLARIGRGTTQQFDITSRLVMSGPYALVRHPVYTASFLIVLTESLCMASPFLLAYALDITILMMFMILWEEKQLRERFGSAYQDYAAVVPACIPRMNSAEVHV